MKKRWLIFAAMVLFALVLTACGSREPQTIEGFTEIMEQASFYVEHDSDGTISAAWAIDAEQRFEIAFYVFESDVEANRAFNQIRSDFNTMTGGVVSRSEVNTSGHNIYRLRSGGTIYRASRIENTLAFVIADDAYTRYVDDALDAIGYR